jgi:Flp pilus assembly protein TadD
MRVLGTVVLLAGCARNGIPEDAIEEMPAWRTHGEEVRLAVTTELLETGNTLGALDIIRQMRSEGFDGPELDYLQGKALRIDGVVSEAERMLVTAQKRMPKDARPSAELCILFADLNQVDQAIERCKRATEIDPSSGGAWNNLGFLLLSAEHPTEALEAAERAIDIDGAEPRFRNNLAMAQAALGREDQAYRTLQSTMSRADAAYMVGVVVERFAGMDGARPWYEKAVAIDPDHPQAKPRLDPESVSAAEPALPAVNPISLPDPDPGTEEEP